MKMNGAGESRDEGACREALRRRDPGQRDGGQSLPDREGVKGTAGQDTVGRAWQGVTRGDQRARCPVVRLEGQRAVFRWSCRYRLHSSRKTPMLFQGGNASFMPHRGCRSQKDREPLLQAGRGLGRTVDFQKQVREYISYLFEKQMNGFG